MPVFVCPPSRGVTICRSVCSNSEAELRERGRYALSPELRTKLCVSGWKQTRAISRCLFCAVYTVLSVSTCSCVRACNSECFCVCVIVCVCVCSLRISVCTCVCACVSRFANPPSTTEVEGRGLSASLPSWWGAVMAACSAEPVIGGAGWGLNCLQLLGSE